MKISFTQMLKGSLLLMGISSVYFTAVACEPAAGQTRVIKVEAEDYLDRSASNDMVVQSGDPDYVSEGKYVNELRANAWAKYEITVPTAGTYELALFYFSMDASRYVGVYVNKQSMYRVLCDEVSADWSGSPRETEEGTLPGGAACRSTLIYMEAGTNVLKIGGAGSGWGPNLDYFEIYTTDEVIEPHPSLKDIYDWSYAREIQKNKITADVNPESVKNIFDEKENTYYEPGSEAAVEWEFEYPMSITGMLVYSDADAKVSDWILLRSTDKEEWNEMSIFLRGELGEGIVYGLDLLDEDGGKSLKPDVRKENGYISQYFKLIIPQGAKINELQLFGYPVEDPFLNYPADATGDPYIYIAAENPEDPKVWKEQVDMNDNIGSLWYSNEGIGDPWYENYTHLLNRYPDQYTAQLERKDTPVEVGYEFYDFNHIKAYSLAVCEQGWTGRNPRSWKFMASDDFGDNWVVLHEVENFSFPKCDFVNMKFEIPEYEGDYIYYKIELMGSGDDMLHLSEFQLFEESLTPNSNKVLNKDTNNVLVYAVKNAVVLSRINETSAQKYQIFDLTGKVVAQGFTTNADTTVSLNSGVYIVKIASASSTEVTKVIVR